MSNIVELRELSNEKLEAKLEEARAEMFNLRFQLAGKRLSNPVRVRTVRREMARIQSLLHHRKLAVEAAAGHPEIAGALTGRDWSADARFVYEESGWKVDFSADGNPVATAMVDLNRKRPVTRRQRDLKGEPQLVRQYEIR
jgi:large subunit ribosomal protein L29